MKQSVNHLTFDAPTGFCPEETTLSLRAPADNGVRDPRLLQKQLQVRPNLVVHQRPATKREDLKQASTKIFSEIRDSFKNLKDLSQSEVTFADGEKGVLIRYEMQVTQAHVIRQWQALRVDEKMVTTFTLTTGVDTSEATQKAYLDCLTSARLS